MKTIQDENLHHKELDKSIVLQCKLQLLPIMDAMYIISGKWRIPITIALMQGKKRFGEIQKEVPKITAKVLSHELKQMEMNGFVEKKIHKNNSLRAEYELTDYSWSVKPIILSLKDFGVEHRKKIKEERGRKSSKPE